MLSQAEYGRFRADALRSIAAETVRNPPVEEGAVSLAAAVSDWLDANYEDRLGGYDPERVTAVVPVDPDDVRAGGTTPMREDTGGDADRQRLHAYRAVRTDLLDDLAGDADGLGRAIAVHDALELLVGARGEPADRSPADVTGAFASWVADREDERVARRVGGAFTVLHVMRIATLDGSDLTAAVADWLDVAHPGALDDPPTVER